MEKVFAICDSDSMYATRFMEFLKKRVDFDFEIAAFTRVESLEEYCKEHRIEILLAGEEFLNMEQNSARIKYIYELSEQRDRERTSAVPGIFRYQSVRNIMNEVLLDYNNKEHKEGISHGNPHMKVISVFAPIPDINKLIFAWSFAGILSERRKVLFIPLDALPTRILTQEVTEQYGLSDLIYYLKENNSNLLTKLRTQIQHNGSLSFLSGLTNGLDLFSLDEEEADRLIESLGHQTDYQMVIFYISHYSGTMVEFLKQSDELFLTSSDSPYEASVLKEWLRQMDFIGLTEKTSRIHKLYLPKENWNNRACSLLQELKGYETYRYAMEAADKLLGPEEVWTR